MIVKIESYMCHCDNCDEFSESYQGFSIFTDEETARVEMEEIGWHTEGDKHYCDKCHSFDDNDKLIINSSRTKEIKPEAKTDEWIPVSERLPDAYEAGDWDGKRTDFVLVRYGDNTYDVARMYRGFMDGSEFSDWYDKNDNDLDGIPIEWKEIK